MLLDVEVVMMLEMMVILVVEILKLVSGCACTTDVLM